MSFARLDTPELLHLALNAMNADRDAEAIELLKTLLEREPANGQAHFLLAAMHAQLGMPDRAEAGFRAAIAAIPDLPLARFQLGQLLLLQGRGEEAFEALAPINAAVAGEAVSAYARGLQALARNDASAAMAELQSGLDCPQEIPALAGDMQRLLARLQSAEPAAPAAPLFLSGYGRGH